MRAVYSEKDFQLAVGDHLAGHQNRRPTLGEIQRLRDSYEAGVFHVVGILICRASRTPPEQEEGTRQAFGLAAGLPSREFADTLIQARLKLLQAESPRIHCEELHNIIPAPFDTVQDVGTGLV